MLNAAAEQTNDMPKTIEKFGGNVFVKRTTRNSATGGGGRLMAARAGLSSKGLTCDAGDLRTVAATVLKWKLPVPAVHVQCHDKCCSGRAKAKFVKG